MYNKDPNRIENLLRQDLLASNGYHFFHYTKYAPHDDKLDRPYILDKVNYSARENAWFDHLYRLAISGESNPLVNSFKDSMKLFGLLTNSRGSIYPSFYKNSDSTVFNAQYATQAQAREILRLCGSTLEELYISDTHLPDLDLSAFPRLKRLKLVNNRDLSDIKGLSTLKQLEILEIVDCPKISGVNLDDFRSLRILNLFRSGIQNIQISHPLPQLKYADFAESRLTDTKFLRFFPELRVLDLSYTPIGEIARHSLPAGLGILSLSGIKSLEYIPPEIRNIKQLKTLVLKDLKLQDIPDWLPELDLPFVRDPFAPSTLVADYKNDTYSDGISLSGTKIANVEMSIFDQPRELIIQWFQERKNRTETPRPLNEIKVVFLGDGEAGKSLTVARLLGDGAFPAHFDSDATPGIAIANKNYKIGDREIQVHFWDFGGQEILHSMHRMFLTNRTLYVILLSARDDTQDDRARYWLHNIKSFADGAQVLLVLNKMDQNPAASVNEQDLRSVYGGLTEVVKMSALKDSAEDFRNNFTAALMRRIDAFETLGSPFLPSWSLLKDRLQNMTDNYIRGDRYIQLCEECGVAAVGETYKHLLNWFHDLGVSFCYSDSEMLADYMILRPEWITNAIYMIIFNEHPDLKNGTLSHSSILKMLSLKVDHPEKVRRVLPDVTYNADQTTYVLNVIRKFSLSYLMRDGLEFIPMLCQRDTKPIAGEYDSDPDVLEFQMRYDYLPNNVIHRLMVDLRRDLDTENVWRTGARLVRPAFGVSAIVKGEGNVLRIMVRAEKPGVRPREYLDDIRRTIEEINSSLGLTVASTEIVYRADGKKESFDYEMLLNTRDGGVPVFYSRIHRGMIPIDLILGQSRRGLDPEQARLIDGLVQICRAMQEDYNCWNRDEDGLNTYVRNQLELLGYEVHDQRLSGLGAGGQRAGELDLVINREKNVPFTICEALRITEKSGVAGWNSHLDKLLNRYNRSGLPFLIQLCYANASPDHFGRLWEKFDNHMRTHQPPSHGLRRYLALQTDPDGYDPSSMLRGALCEYIRTGSQDATTVIHLFVQIGD